MNAQILKFGIPVLLLAGVGYLVVSESGGNEEVPPVQENNDGNSTSGRDGNQSQPLTGSSGNALARSKGVESFWQRTMPLVAHRYLEPFRKPPGLSQDNLDYPRAWLDLARLRKLRDQAKADKVRFDKNGREVVDDKRWREQFERLSIGNRTMQSFMANIFWRSKLPEQRRNAAYGIFYLPTDDDAVQRVVTLIEGIGSEPVDRTRREGMQRALRYLAVHLPKSKPLRKERPGGFQVPRFNFNPYAYLQLASHKEASKQVEGLSFLAEVLRIRPDLGRLYLQQLRKPMKRLLDSQSRVVRERAAALIEVVVRAMPEGGGDLPRPSDNTAGLLQPWWRAVDAALYPPIEHVSSGLTILQPGKVLDRIESVGRDLLGRKDAIGAPVDGKLASGHYYRGFKVRRLDDPLHLLQIPLGSVVTNVNNVPVTDCTMALREAEAVAKRWREAEDKRLKQLEDARQNNTKTLIRAAAPLVFQLTYVHRGKLWIKDFRVVRP